MYTSPHRENFNYTCLRDCSYSQQSFDTEIHAVTTLEKCTHEKAMFEVLEAFVAHQRQCMPDKRL